MRGNPFSWGALVMWGALAASCTLGGLGEYEIEACDPRVTSAEEDVCQRLESSDPCQPYQCAPGGTCVKGPRDADRDGDPDLACGGTDCDDTNRLISGIVTEVCDSMDNDCNGLVDEGVLSPGARNEMAELGPLSSKQTNDVSIGGTGAPGSELVGVSVVDKVPGGSQGTCLRTARLPGGALTEGCSLLGSELHLNPRHPFAQRMDSLTGVVFISPSSECPGGQVMYRVGPGMEGAADQYCFPAKPGAALPAFVPMPAPSGDALVAWYEVNVAERDDRYGSCPGANAAPLVFATLRNHRESDPVLGATVEIVADANSVAPPALLPVTNPAGVLLVSPVGASAAAWLISGEPLTAQGPAWLHTFGGARAVSAAIREADGVVHILAVGEIGCVPQSLRFSLGTLDGSGALAFDDAVEIVPSLPNVVVGRPAAQWVQARNEWRVTWATRSVNAGVMVQRLTADGRKIGEPMEVAAGSLQGATGADGRVYSFEPGTGSNRFWQVPLECGL